MWRIFAGGLHVVIALLLAVVVNTWATALYAAIVLAVRLWLRHRRGDRPPRRTLRFTREGRYLVAITLGVGFAAINTGNNLLYLFLGMLLSMIIISGVLSEQTLRGLEVVRELPPQVFAQRPFLTGIVLGNRKRHLPSFSVQVEDIIQGRPLSKKCYFLKVPAQARQSTSYRTEFNRRGLYRYEGLKIDTRFPFAFFVKSRRYDAPAELVVFPAIQPIGHLPLEARSLLGAVARPRRGAGRDFHSLRDYRLGDDARDIHWKRSAREGRLMLREFETEGGRRITVVLNDRVPADFDLADDTRQGELEQCVELTASLAVHFAQRGYAVTVRTVEEHRTLGSDGRGFDGLMRWLALLPFRRAEPEPASLRPPARSTDHWLLVTHCRARLAVGSVAFTRVFEMGA
ncbi:MAG: DUF58 domain-containing protein [Myxococcales bacterium]|nr:DUF58 domain-containing protein [Myxococcales bacterium]